MRRRLLALVENDREIRTTLSRTDAYVRKHGGVLIRSAEGVRFAYTENPNPSANKPELEFIQDAEQTDYLDRNTSV